MRKICATCARVIEVLEREAGRVGWTDLVDHFAAAGLSRIQVDRVLDAEIGERPALRDELTSTMANTLMRGLGMPGRQSPEDVQRIRRAAARGAGEGTWAAGAASSKAGTR
ncbi:MAG TPA: hypothetical protein VKS22_11715 [Candidatus Binataceae bacterium]|nr:hypothetical protein [Candidatus Binataceae bacterium]